jgi:hypothetical protein
MSVARADGDEAMEQKCESECCESRNADSEGEREREKDRKRECVKVCRYVLRSVESLGGCVRGGGCCETGDGRTD